MHLAHSVRPCHTFPGSWTKSSGKWVKKKCVDAVRESMRVGWCFQRKGGELLSMEPHCTHVCGETLTNHTYSCITNPAGVPTPGQRRRTRTYTTPRPPTQTTSSHRLFPRRYKWAPVDADAAPLAEYTKRGYQRQGPDRLYTLSKKKGFNQWRHGTTPGGKQHVDRRSS